MIKQPFLVTGYVSGPCATLAAHLATGLGCRVEAVHKLLDRSLGDAVAGVQLPVSAHDWHAGRHATAGDGLAEQEEIR